MNHAEDEVAARDPMPESNQHHGRQEAEGQSPATPTAQAHSEGREDVIPKPPRQTHMPALPELSDVRGQEWTVEVWGTLDAKEPTNPKRKVRVPREVGENLKNVDIDGQH